MPLKTLLDISAENFDYFFANEAKNISPIAKESLPRDIAYRLYKGGASFNPKYTSRLNFLQRIFVLWKCLKKRIYIVVEDEENGITEGEFLKLRQQLKQRDYGIDKASSFMPSATFVLANKELCDSFSYMNRLCISPAYNYLTKGKNRIKNPANEWSRQMKYIVRFLMEYDKNKKTWVAEYKLDIPEWYILISLYHGEEVKGSPIHQEIFRRAYQSSQSKLKRSFGTLQAKGLISKTGEGKGAKMRITPLGTDMVNNIVSKYALNF